MAHKLSLFDGRHLVEQFFLQYAIVCIGVDGEVAYAERCQVLEEVSALRGIYMVVLQSCLDDDTGCRDVRPLDGDAQPVVAGAPTSRAYQHIVLVLIQELAVDLLYLVGNLRIVDSRKVVVGLDIDHVDDIL